jgi:spermidine synthase
MSKLKQSSFPYYLMFTAALCGGLVMVVEVLGARVIGPYFGVSLYVWTALITVTLLSLSVGYALGGYLSDKHPSAPWLYGLIIASGVLVILVPTLKPWVIQLAVPLGLRGGALISAVLLFAPALLLLGCVSPYAVKIAAREWASLGRTVGVLYALSTLGSMLGTALAGYVIIGFVGVARAFHLCGALLIILGLAYFAFYVRRIGTIAGAVALSAFLLLPETSLPTTVMADGTKARLIENRDSFYGNVKVVEYAGTQFQTRELLIDGLIQSAIDQRTGDSIYEYTYLLESLPLEVKPDTRSALIIGLGAGVIADRLQQRNVAVDVVDIDPVVVQMAAKHFNLRLKRPVVIEDARYFLAQDGPLYDVIIMDAFSGDSTPSHLLTRESMERVKARLAPDGVLAINVIAGPLLAPAIVGTLQTQFSEIAAFPLFDLADSQVRVGNLVLIAANRPVARTLAARFRLVHPMARTTLELGLRQGTLLRSYQNPLILTDDFNPLDVLNIELHESVRRNILETTPAAILLYG